MSSKKTRARAPVVDRTMRFAIADPPYLGSSVKLYAHHPEAAVYDGVAGHAALISRLVSEFPDGWALCMGSNNLRDLLPLCPPAARVMAWVKPFASFKPGVGVAYAWEPVIVCGGRKRTRRQDTMRDWLSANITLKRGLAGAKPAVFTRWLLDVLNARPGDEIADLFPGTGAISAAVAARLSRPEQLELLPSVEQPRKRKGAPA